MKKILLLGGNGYVGSRFYQDWSTTFDIKSVDLCLFEKDLGYSTKSNYINYLAQNASEVQSYDAIICLAGHSSVRMANYNSNRSWSNNVEYFRFLCNSITDEQTLIYASSASVYGISAEICRETDPINLNTINHYDLQKTVIDLIANQYINQNKKIIGLRFGTVNGTAPNTRIDLMLNSMVHSALTSGKIYVKNVRVKRAILGISDASRALEQIVQSSLGPGQYNVSSFNSTVRDLANTVARITQAEIVNEPDSDQAYDFMISNAKFIRSCEFSFNDSPESLVQDLYRTLNQVNLGRRDDDLNFENGINEQL